MSETSPAPMKPVIERIGGEETVRALVERFYDLVETLPEGAQILHLHFRGHGLAHVRGEQFEFLTAFFGGRRSFVERHGHMNLRTMHAHVPIRPEDAENWLYCMDLALADTGITDPLRSQIFQTFGRAAHMLVNREAGSAPE